MLLLLTTNGARKRLGHASVVITLDVYSHVLPTMQKDATDNAHCTLARRGKNKQKRGDLRQVGLAMVVERE